MAKLNIDFAVNLGSSVGEINKVVEALTNLNLQVKDLAKNLSSISNKKIAPKVEAEVKVKEPSVTPTIKANVQADFGKGPLGNVFDKYIQGATQATTVTGFLKEREKELTAEIKRLQQVAGNTSSLVEYSSAIKQIQVNTQQLNAIKGADPFGKLNASANQANLVLTNVGRVAQDLPFGFLGIANNLNPLVESFRSLKIEAKEAGTSVGKQLLSSLKGFGGLGLVISGVSAALSFASIGLSYWTRKSKDAKEGTDEFRESNKRLKEEEERLKAAIDNTNQAIDTRNQFTRYASELQIIKAGALGKSIEEVRKIEDDFFKSVQEDPTTGTKGLIPRALDDQKEAEKNYVNFIAAAAERQGASYDKIQEIRRNYYNKSIFDANKFRENLSASEKQEFDILGKEVSDKQKAYQEVNREYNLLVAKRALDDFKEKQKRENKEIKNAADIYKEIYADLQKIESKTNLNPLQKAEDSSKVIISGLDKVVDLEGTIRIQDKEFKDLEKRRRDFELNALKLSVSADLNNLSNSLADLKEEAVIFDKSTIDGQISAVESTIDELYKKYRSPIISGNIFEQQAILANIRNLQDQLNSLNVKKLQEDIGNLEINLKTNLEELQIKEDILDTSLLKDKISVAEKALDSGLDLLVNKVVQKTPILKAAAETFVKAATDKLKLLEKQRIEQVFQLAARYELLGDPIEAAKIRISAFTEALKKELSKTNFSIEYALVLKALIKKDEAKSDLEKAGEKNGKAFGEAFSKAIGDTFVNLGKGIGDAFSSGEPGAALLNLQKQIGEALISFGTSMIMASELIEKAKKLLGNPGGIVAGIALVAFGTILANTASQKLSALKKASGGYISGPGSGTSDSIPARLSNGEYVVKARSVSKYGIGFLNAVNNGTLKKFAVGGAVSNIPIPNFAAPNVTITEPMGQQVPYIATTQIKGQDLRLVLQRADSRYNRIV